jgi:predicted acyl esterase
VGSFPEKTYSKGIMMLRKLTCLIICLSLLIAIPLLAQDAETLPTPERIEVTASDGLTLVGDFYTVPDAEGEMPSVLLLHMRSGDRHQWNLLIEPLLDNGFNALAVDMRGDGETGGNHNLVEDIHDVQVWLNWLREQPSVEDNSISTIGASRGTVPALAGCSADPACVTAIVMSPGDFPLLDEAMYDGLSERSVLFIVGRNDNVLYDTNKMFSRTTGEAAMQIYNTGVHGTDFFSYRSAYRDRVIDLMVNWINDHLQRLQIED